MSALKLNPPQMWDFPLGIRTHLHPLILETVSFVGQDFFSFEDSIWIIMDDIIVAVLMELKTLTG